MKIVLVVGEPGYNDQATANAAIDTMNADAVMYRDTLAGNLVKQYALDNHISWYSVPDEWLQSGYLASVDWMDEFTPQEVLILPTALSMDSIINKAQSHSIVVWRATGSVGGSDLNVTLVP